mgnify:CR=1 FL=1
MFDYFDEVLKDIGDLMNIDFAKRVRTLGDIKQIQYEQEEGIIVQRIIA